MIQQVRQSNREISHDTFVRNKRCIFSNRVSDFVPFFSNLSSQQSNIIVVEFKVFTEISFVILLLNVASSYFIVFRLFFFECFANTRNYV